jgi:hypothetical protein
MDMHEFKIFLKLMFVWWAPLIVIGLLYIGTPY